MNDASPSIRFERVSKWYGLVLGLNEVTATFGPGVSGLLGPNGAGKSTLMKLACGMLAPSIGEVRVCGETPFDNAPIMRRVGLCPEQDAVYASGSALDVTTYLTRLHGFAPREARDRAAATLERVGLGTVLGRKISTFSKGMRQRAKLAQALAHDPDVLILDEPLNGLDPPGRRELSNVIRASGAAGKCVLVSSHILHEVEALTPNVLLISTGRVLAEGSVAEIRAELPDHPLTVRIRARDPAQLASVLAAVAGTERLHLREDGVDVVTLQAHALLDRVAELATEDPSAVLGVEPLDEDLEAVFRYLTR